jgi:hypothetical protein
MTTSSTDAQAAPEAKPAASAPQTNANAAPTVIDKIVRQVKKLLGGS